MSTIEQTKQGIPTGTWKADTVHSRVAFEVPYAVATFTGEVPEFEATLEDGNARPASRSIASLKVKEENLRGAPAVAGVLRRRAAPRGDVRLRDRSAATATHVEIDGEITIKGITQPAKLTGTATGPAVDHFGANRFGLQLQTTVDRTAFDMNWNMPLPNGEPALAQRGHPEGRADPGGSRRRSHARPRDQRLAPRRLVQHGPPPRTARGGAGGRSRSSSGTGSKEIPPYDADDDVVPGPDAVEALPRSWFARRTRSSSQRPSTTRRFRARSRTRSTGRRARSRRTRSATSPSP